MKVRSDFTGPQTYDPKAERDALDQAVQKKATGILLAVNQTVFLRLFLTSAGKTPVVPEPAIIDDAGRPVVFVQKGGETFLRRPVKIGIRNTGMVQVLEGVNPGDRVVTKGAYLIRLSTMSSAVPAHGHVH